MTDINDPREYAEEFLKIRTKDGRVRPFEWNAAQERLYAEVKKQREAGRPVRVVVLKARQLGVSTLAEGLIFHDTATSFNIDSLIVAHVEEATANLFKMTKMFYEELPGPLKPMLKASNAQELLFENPTKRAMEKLRQPGLRSRIRCITAGGRGAGRSYTAQNLHASEVAFWPGDVSETWAGVMQAVPSEPGTTVIVESTANGYNWFKDFWDAAVRGENDFAPVFFTWHEEPGYRMAAPPGFEATAEERELQELHGVDDGQLSWRRWCISNNCGGDPDKFRQEYPASPDEAFISTGKPVFDNGAVIRRREEVRGLEPERGEFEYTVMYDESIQFVRLYDRKFRENPGGCAWVYKRPEKGKPYVIGGDTAGDGSDWFTAAVLDNTSGELVAVLRRQYDEDVYARQVYCLGKWYNDALVGVECNFSTYPVALLQRMGYPRQYVRQRTDTYTGKATESYGFRTDAVTRPLIIAGLVGIMREMPWLVSDYETLGEMLTFSKNERGRAEALAGSNDDLVIALAIAHYIRPQQSMEMPKQRLAPHEKWTRDMHEDFERATPEQRDMLLAKWGKPV